MADGTAIVHSNENDASTPAPSPCFVDFVEFPIQCKSEPCTSLTSSTEEDPLVFDESSSLHIPVSIPMIKDPVILLERCDKIWETLQLIKTVQVEKLTTPIDVCDKNEEEKKEEKAQSSNEVKQSVPNIKIQLRSKSDNAVSLPFKFSVQKTRRLYPCSVCGKQYLERRSLRKHSERVHGVVLPLLKRKYMRRIALNKKNFDEASPIASISKENTSSEKLYSNKDSYEKITVKSKLSNIETTASQPAASTQSVKCTLCQQKVTSLRKHLINYHKIGSSSSMVEQLESSLLSETETSPGDKKTTLTNESHQDGLRIMDNENDTHGTSRVKRKAKYTSYYANVRKKLKFHAFVKNPPALQKQSLNVNSYKCSICLGMYSSTHSLYKHKRIHRMRGETKDNFHKFKCRYFNSPFNEKYKLQSSMTSTNTIAKNTSNRVNKNRTLQLNNSKRDTLCNPKGQTYKIDRATRYNERINRCKETICICGRSFRNPHTLFIHKKNCELCQNEDDTTLNTRGSSDRDSGIGINITIKKRNDSYEIVGKDDEDKPQNSETLKNFLTENNSSMSHVSNSTKDFTKTSTKQKVIDTSESSKYSKDHSILKLQDIDEDVLIDIEDDVHFDEDNTTKQMITQGDSKQDLSKQQNDAKNEKTEKVFDKVTTLKQMCQEVLDVLDKRKSKNVENQNKDKEYRQIKVQKTCKENSRVKNSRVKNQETRQENKRKLRSTNKRYQYSEVELDHSYDGAKVCIMQFNPLICGYCKEQFSTIKLYDNHQCTVNEGKSFDKFSLQLSCFYCKEILNNYGEFDDHVRIRHFDNSYHCYQCTERFMSDKARLNHFHSEHNDLICRICSKKISISVKTLHEGYHLGFGYPCHTCKKAYTNNRNLSYHKYTIHANGADNLMTCTICLKLVKLKTFRGHMSTHKHNACHFCGKVFSDRVGLEYHTMLHHGTNSKLKCNICGTRFYTKKQLERHEKVDGCNNDKEKKRKL